jgi:hypothetical protein
VSELLASTFVCFMFAGLVVALWVFWDEGSADRVKRLQDKERERRRIEDTK